MRSKKEIEQELVDCERGATEARQRDELNRQLLVEYEQKVETLLWVLAKEMPIRTEGTR